MFKWIILFLLPFGLFAKENFFSVPVNGKTLEIQVPSTFKVGHKQMTDRMAFVEFVPQNEDINNWNEIITVHEIGGVPELMSYMSISQIQSNLGLKPSEILNDSLSFSKENGILMGMSSIDRPSFLVNKSQCEKMDGINEVMTTKVYQVGNNVWQIQYTVRYPSEKTSTKAKAKIVDKMNAFFSDNVAVR